VIDATQALLLTDVVDSTRLAEELGDEGVSRLWQAHDRAARDLLRQWRGREIDKSDGFLLLFADVADAMGYAMDYHRALHSLAAPVRARAGLHVGPVTLRENDPRDVALGAKPVEMDGLAKSLAARAMSLAQGGQTLITAQARAALATHDARLRSHGHWRVKGLAEPIELFEVRDDGMAFLPPPDSDKVYRVVHRDGLWLPLREIRHNLPAERDAFIGRGAALQHLAERFAAGARLVSVLGTGGMGKTRFAQRFGWTWLGEFPGGVYLCDLSQARSVDGIVQSVAQGLGVPLGKVDPVTQLGNALGGRGACLVILDNFEQVVALAEPTLGQWLDRAPHARFLATSREVLNIGGEQVLELEPLEASEAAALFMRRAEAARDDFRLSALDRDAVEPLVKLLDGLPLAIELAAARARIMPPRTLLERMSERFTLLASKGHRRDRQATLRATFDWSWDLLSAPEKRALAQLSVFQGGFSLPAAEALIDVPPQARATAAPLDLLQSLVEKSLVRQRADGRFHLLVTVQEYAAEHLRTEGRFDGSGPGAQARARQRHCEYFAARGEVNAVADACADLDNLVAACRHAIALDDVPSAVGALEGAWAALYLRGPFRVGLELAERVRGMSACAGPWAARVQRVLGRALRAAGRLAEAGACFESLLNAASAMGDRALASRVLSCLGDLHNHAGRIEKARATLDESLALARELGLRDVEAEVLCGRGNLSENLGDLDEARGYYEAALVVSREAGERRWEGGSLGNLGLLHANQGRLAEARAYYEASLTVVRQLGDRQWEGNTLCNLGLLHHSLGHLAQARTTLGDALVLAKEMGYVRLGAVVMCNLGIVSEAMEDADGARRHFEAALAVSRELGDRRFEGQFLNYLGALHARQGRFEQAWRCLDAAETLLDAVLDKMNLGVVLCSKAEALCLAGDGAQALPLLDRAAALARDVGAEAQSELGIALQRVRRIAPQAFDTR